MAIFVDDNEIEIYGEVLELYNESHEWSHLMNDENQANELMYRRNTNDRSQRIGNPNEFWDIFSFDHDFSPLKHFWREK